MWWFFKLDPDYYDMLKVHLADVSSVAIISSVGFAGSSWLDEPLKTSGYALTVVILFYKLYQMIRDDLRRRRAK